MGTEPDWPAPPVYTQGISPVCGQLVTPRLCTQEALCPEWETHMYLLATEGTGARWGAPGKEGHGHRGEHTGEGTVGRRKHQGQVQQPSTWVMVLCPGCPLQSSGEKHTGG